MRFPILPSVLVASALVAYRCCAWSVGTDSSVADFPRLAGERDDAPRIQRAVDASAARVLRFPAGDYVLSCGVALTNGCSLELHKSARLRAVAPMEGVLRVDAMRQYRPAADDPEGEDYGQFLRGGVIDGNGLASCVLIDNYRHFSVSGMTLLNGRPYGLAVGTKGRGYELMAHDLCLKTLKEGLTGNTAVYTRHTDGHYADIVAVNYTTGFHLAAGGGNRLDRVHVWGGTFPGSLTRSVCFKVDSNNDILRDSSADTGLTGFWINGWNCRLLGCSFLSDPARRQGDGAVIRQDRGSAVASAFQCDRTGSGGACLHAAGPGASLRWTDDCILSGYGERPPARADPLDKAREILWRTLRNRFFSEKTEMLYDVLWRTGDGMVSATACLPSPEEAARQFPNPCSWGTGFQDCVFNGGPYLGVALKRGDRKAALSIFRGLRRCAEVSGVPGFVARGVLPSDGKGYYYNSSRDVWTLFVFYLRRYYHSELCDAETKASIRRLVVDVARYAESCVKPENGYNLLRADGKVGLVSQMWVADPKRPPRTDGAGWDHFGGMCAHETLRLPMFYAAAFELSGDAHWREMELRYLDDGITMAERKIGANIRASILNQMQLSNRLLWETETEPRRKARLWKLLNRAADISRDHVTTRLERDFAAGRWQESRPLADWRKVGYVRRFGGDGGVLNGYRYDVPDHPAPTIEDSYVEAAHALLVQAMVPNREIHGRTLRLFLDAIERLDLENVACANAVNALLAMYQKY